MNVGRVHIEAVLVDAATNTARSNTERQVLARAVRTVDDALGRVFARWGPDAIQGRDEIVVEIDRSRSFRGNAAWSDALISVSPHREPGARRGVATSLDTMLHEIGHGMFDSVSPQAASSSSTWWHRGYQELGADLVALGARPGGAGDWRMFADGSAAVAGIRELGAIVDPTRIRLGATPAPYDLASFLGGIPRDAVAAGVSERVVLDAWVSALSRESKILTRAGRNAPELASSIDRLRSSTIRSVGEAEGVAARRIMSDAWQRRSLAKVTLS